MTASRASEVSEAPTQAQPETQAQQKITGVSLSRLGLTQPSPGDTAEPAWRSDTRGHRQRGPGSPDVLAEDFGSGPWGGRWSPPRESRAERDCVARTHVHGCVHTSHAWRRWMGLDARPGGRPERRVFWPIHREVTDRKRNRPGNGTSSLHGEKSSWTFPLSLSELPLCQLNCPPPCPVSSRRIPG